MNSIRAAATGAALVLLAALAACGDHIDNSQVPQASQASVEINRQGMEGAKDTDSGIAVANAGSSDGNVHSLGAKGGTSVMDPDVLISEQVKAALASSPDFGSSSKVDVHSADGDVTLRGRAPDPDAKERAEAIARSIPNVRSVNNELTLG